MPQHYDAIISGGGSVGLAFAAALGQLQYRVLVIEKKPPSTHSPSLLDTRTVALSYGSLAILHDCGVCLSDVVPIEAVRVSVKGRFGTSTLRANDHGVPSLGGVVSFQALEAALLDALADFPHVEVVSQAAIKEAQCTPEGWRVSVTGGPQDIFTRLLVSAEGLHSSLPSLVGIGQRVKTYAHHAVLANVAINTSTPFMAHERFLPQGAIALIPFKAPFATLIVTLSSSQAKTLFEKDEAHFLGDCQKMMGQHWGSFREVGKRHCIKLGSSVATQQHGARFLLMGNSAHTIHPIAAQGLNLSLRDVFGFKEILKQCGAGQDVGDERVLAQYESARASDQRSVMFATDGIARFMSDGPLPSIAKAMGVTLFDSMGLGKRLFTQRAMGL